mgnify:FL=1
MITAAIVLFNNDFEILNKTINSFLNIKLDKKLFLIDNSKNTQVKDIFSSSEIEYVFVGKNIGFGRAHNLILDRIHSDFHLILNPDVEFSPDVIPILIDQLKKKATVSFITPKVIYPNKNSQYVCRKHPTLFNLINRNLNFNKRLVLKNQYRDRDLNKPFYPDFIHGCFMLFKTKDFKNLKGFDSRYFLYMEDADLCRKIDKSGKKILYYPEVEIIHQHQKGSSKSIKLFFYHLSSAFKYFLKWGI